MIENNNGAVVQKVEIVDIRMRFGSMVVFLVKLAIAAVPAILVLSVIGLFLFGIASAILRIAFIGH